MKSQIPCSEITVSPGIALYHTGPSLDHGPLPSFFYLALSGPDSLSLDPFNQPVQFLKGRMIRIFSMTLPGHENQLPPEGALNLWAEQISRGIDPIDPFLDQAAQAIEFAMRERFVDPTKLAVGGLSRGGFMAAHLAARDPRFRFLLGFAPLTRLGKAKELEGLAHHPIVRSLDTNLLAEALCDRHVRFYIGNRDTRTGTRDCFDFSMTLVETAHEKKIRSPQIELLISPSVGRFGHGTPPEIFSQGAEWIARHLASAAGG